jgi:hypothetical protein
VSKAPLPAPAVGAPVAGEATAAGLSRGLLGYWRFEELAGLVRDQSANHLDCQGHKLDLGRAGVDGVAGRALRFDGYGYLECGQPESVTRIGEAMTVAGWINFNQPEHDLRAILGWQRGHGGRFGLFFGVAGTKLVLASDVWGRIEAPLEAPVGRWVHVAASRAPDGRKRLFIDGVEVASDGSRHVPLGTGAYPLTVGGHIHAGLPLRVKQKLHAALDELALYDRALSPAEIALLASHQAPAPLAQQLAPR